MTSHTSWPLRNNFFNWRTLRKAYGWVHFHLYPSEKPMDEFTFTCSPLEKPMDVFTFTCTPSEKPMDEFTFTCTPSEKPIEGFTFNSTPQKDLQMSSLSPVLTRNAYVFPLENTYWFTFTVNNICQKYLTYCYFYQHPESDQLVKLLSFIYSILFLPAPRNWCNQEYVNSALSHQMRDLYPI